MEYFLADDLILLLDLLQLLFVEVPVASRDILVLIRRKCFDRGLQVPNLPEQIHVLPLQVGLLLLESELFGR